MATYDVFDERLTAARLRRAKAPNSALSRTAAKKLREEIVEGLQSWFSIHRDGVLFDRRRADRRRAYDELLAESEVLRAQSAFVTLKLQNIVKDAEADTLATSGAWYR